MKILMLAVFAAILSLIAADGCCTTSTRKTLIKIWNDLYRSNGKGNRLALAHAIAEELIANDEYFKSYAEKQGVTDLTTPQAKALELVLLSEIDIAVNSLMAPKILKAKFKRFVTTLAQVTGAKVSRDNLKALNEAVIKQLQVVADCFYPEEWRSCFVALADYAQ